MPYAKLYFKGQDHFKMNPKTDLENNNERVSQEQIERGSKARENV